MNKKKILIMAGGTGGHIFPALVIADELSKIGWEILWLGTQNRMESSIVPQYGYNIKFIKVDGIKGNGFKKLIQAPFMILRATFQARKIIKKFKPDIALGMGGFVTGPGGVAAKTLNIPLVIHESNAVAGITNKLLAKISNVILQAFPGTIKNAITVGNPIRAEIINTDFSIGIDDDKDRPLNILVMGGSQGARVMNERVSRTLDQLQEFNILHQSGKNQSESTKKNYINQKANVVDFIDDVSEAYKWADLAICRSGALTVSELAVSGLPAIFVPYKHGDNQQKLNAKYLVENKVSYLIEEDSFLEDNINSTISSLTREKLLSMSQKTKRLGQIDSTKKIIKILREVK